MSIKIQLNSVAMLEKLLEMIAGDPEIELDLRNQIVQEFTKKHLKSLAGDSAITRMINYHIQQLETQIKDKVRTEIKAHLRANPILETDWLSKIVIREEHRDAIRLFVHNLTYKEIQDAVVKEVEKQKEFIESFVNKEIFDTVKKEVTAKALKYLIEEK